MTEVVSVRVPQGTRTQLKLLACRESLEQQREIRWAALVRQAIHQVLTHKEKK